MKIAILHSSPKPTWTSKRLLEAVERHGATPYYMLWNYLAARIDSSTCPLRYRGKCLEVDAIIVRSLGRGLSVEKYTARIAILRTAKEHGYIVVNPPDAMITARDKFTSLRLLKEAGLPVPKTVITEDPAQAMQTIREFKAVVFKPIMGSLGLGSFRVENVDVGYHIINLLMELNQPLYVQEFIEKKNNRDMRLFVVGSQVVAAMYRVAVNSWKTNVAQGARTIPASPPPEIVEAAIKAAKVLGLVYAGVDIAEVEAEPGYIIFEVNASPLWRGLYNTTGVDPAEHIVRTVIELAKK